MASTSAETSHPVVFTTQTAYPLPSQKFMIPTSWKRYQLSQLVNKALSLPKPLPFDFLVRGEILRGTLAEWCAEKGIGEEETLEIEYFESVMPPQKMSTLPHEDWVSSVSCQLPGYLFTASYDGTIRTFDYSQKLLHSAAIHTAPTTSICLVPLSSSSKHFIASASHDLTARLTTLSLPSDSSKPVESQTVTSLHLHTAPLASISANASGSHLLTASWDGLIGVWDTSIPASDEVPADEPAERKKRRRVEDDASRPKRKAPLSVLKSHTARVSKAVFGRGEGAAQEAYSCGFDSTIRVWDVENGVCTQTIAASSKPFLDLALTPAGTSALACATDRTVSQYDFRTAATNISASAASLLHPATPSCVAVPPPSGAEHQLLTGAYDGIVRLWDLRSTKSAVTSFRVWEGSEKKGKKVLSVDWARGVVGVGGEGGVEIWRVGEGGRMFLGN
ncbi:WD40 repeat-like protein [Rhodofomes roseus]|uniref:Ribosome biogenesis protein YTM1 n=1 Tax=Rhodofomes roseus TaxID=34475 RepID=A0ABQ8KD87_9APHY|nr:WD40 repeat-like protein [Rhodofomes roseus]KAH9835016.1 WD40 repeat-like protein [Rhodofomes roseus]